MNNMIGAAIEAILKYCKIRNSLNPKDMTSLIGFNDNAHLIYKNLSVSETDQILKDCLSKLKPEKCTFFDRAFNEAFNILNSIERNQFIPVIIMLSDGLDHSTNTIDYLEKKVSKK